MENSIEKLLIDWLDFAKDVQPNDAAGADWLEWLRNRTNAELQNLQQPQLQQAGVSGSLHPADGFKYMCSECDIGYDCVNCGCPRCNDR